MQKTQIKIYILLIATFFGCLAFFNFTRVQVAKAQTTCPILPTDKGIASSTITISSAGNYKFWSRINATGDSGNSYYLQIDNNCGVDVGDLVGMSPNTWTWVDYQDGNSGSKTTVNLTTGSHQIKLIGKEVGLKLDRVIFTQDVTCIPTSTGDNCATAPVTKIGDVTGDGKVNILDVSRVIDKWGATTKPVEDLNQDGNVDIKDISLIIDNWG